MYKRRLQRKKVFYALGLLMTRLMERFKLDISKGFPIVSTVKLWSKHLIRLWPVHHKRLLKMIGQICVRHDTDVVDTILPYPLF